MASSARIDELRKKFDENPRRYFAPLANEYRKAGEIEQAIAICREHLPQQPGHMSGHIVFGQALYEARQFEEASSVFETALTLDPENLIALRHLGDIALILGNSDAARAWYRRVLEADPRNEEIQSQLATLDKAASEAPTPAIGPPAQPQEPAPAPPARPPSSSAPTVVMSAVPRPGMEQAPQQPPPAVAPPAAVPEQPVTAVSPTAEIVLEDLVPNAPAPHSAPTESAIPTVEIETTSFEPPPPQELGSALEGLEATAASPAGGEPPADSFSLDGLETTSMVAEPPPAATPEALPDLELSGTGVLDLQAAQTAPAGAALPAEPASPAASDAGALDLDLSSLGASTAASAEPEQAIAADAPTVADSSSSSLEFDIPAPPPAPAPRAPEPEQVVAIDLPAAEPPAPAAGGSPSPRPLLEERPPVLEEQQLEPAPAPPGAAPATTGPKADIDQETSPFVTETMAELYLQQGHREEALSVYRALLAQRPNDAKLREKVDQLSQPSAPAATPSGAAATGPSIRHVLRLVALRRPGFRPEPLADNGIKVGSVAPDGIEYPAPAAPAGAVAAPVPVADGSPGPDDALASHFGFVAPARADQHAALALAMAFAHTGNGDASGSLLTGAPARAASSELSLDQVFGEQPAPQPAKSFSFDQFFSQRASAEHSSVVDTGSGGDAVESAHDVAQFNQWLEGLKRR